VNREGHPVPVPSQWTSMLAPWAGEPEAEQP